MALPDNEIRDIANAIICTYLDDGIDPATVYEHPLCRDIIDDEDLGEITDRIRYTLDRLARLLRSTATVEGGASS